MIVFSRRDINRNPSFLATLIATLVGGFIVLTASHPIYAETTVTAVVPDTNLYNALKTSANCATFNDSAQEISITESCQKSITNLYLEYSNISNLDSLPILFPYLEGLYLDNNNLTDISPISSFGKLRSLSIRDNNISSLPSLENYAYLIYLDLSDNNITSISALSDLSSIKEIHIDNNQVSDLSPLSHLNTLTMLFASNNQISDISNLPDSLIQLSAGNNQISDISHLHDMPNLRIYGVRNQTLNYTIENDTLPAPQIFQNFTIVVTELDNCPIDDSLCINATNANLSDNITTINVEDPSKPAQLILQYGDEVYLTINIISTYSQSTLTEETDDSIVDLPATSDPISAYLLIAIISIAGILIFAKNTQDDKNYSCDPES